MTTTTAPSNARIANTIMAQLGGHKFIAMTGARNLVVIASGAQFDLPARFAKNKATRVQIVLVGDLYVLAFYRWDARNLRLQPIGGAHNGLDVEALRRTFTAETGLDLHL